MALPFVLSIPHCASLIPDEIKSCMALGDNEILESVDFGTREIFGRIPAQETIMAQCNRLVVDLNRSPERLDAKGVAALTDYHGRTVFRPGQDPDHNTVIERLNQYHHPYHAALEKALQNPKTIALIDGHSLNGIGPANAPDPGQKRKDIILSNNGDADGKPRPSKGRLSCSPDVIHVFRSAFERQGLSVALNHPFQGGYIVNHYGDLLRDSNRFAIQIELNQDLYMAPGDLFPDQRRIELVYQQVLKALEAVEASL